MSNGHPAYLWWNGEQVRWEDATVHVTELGWSTVNGVFEGIRAYWNPETEQLNIFRLREHLRRLQQSMRMVHLSLDYSIDELTAAILDLLQANEIREDTYIRPMGYSGGASNKRFAQLGNDSSLLINTMPHPTHLRTGRTQIAKVSSWTRISDDVMPPRIKNFSNYRNGRLAATEAKQDGYDVPILLTGQGKVAESSGACVMLVRDGKLITPDPTSSILESITRDALLTLAHDVLGLDVVERVVDRTELYIADEVFLCGTAAEITPIISVDKYEVGTGEIGPVTRRLEKVFHDVLLGNEARYERWRTPVPVKQTAAVV